MNQGTDAQSFVSGPTLEEPALVRGAVSAAHCSPVAHSPDTRAPLSGERNDLARPARTIFGLSMGAFGPSRGVLNTISQAKCLEASRRQCFSLRNSIVIVRSM